MPIQTSAVPVAAKAALPALAWAATGPWWAIPVLGLLTGILLMIATEWAKARYARPRLDIDIITARERIDGDKRDDIRDLMGQNLEMLKAAKELISDNAELKATTRIQAYKIERLEADVTRLQTENDALSALRGQVVVLEGQVRDLQDKLRERDQEVHRLSEQLRATKGTP